MRIDPVEHSTRRRPAARSWGPAGEAPTYLPPDEELFVPQSQSRPKSDSVITSAPRAAKVAELQSRRPSQSTVQPKKVRAASESVPALPPAPMPAAVPAERASQSKSQQSARGSQPQMPAQPAQAPVQLPPMVQFEGGASFDPLAIPLPPELAPSIYGWLRRLALQADLPGADRLLRDAVADLTSALNIIIIYAGPDGLHSLGANDEMPKDEEPIMAVAKSRRAIVSTHTAYLPICTTSETIAVIALSRKSAQPAFTLVDNVTMAAIARESAAVMHHLVVQHLQRRTELESDKKSLYRPEALESHRKKGQEGVVAELSPGWVKRTYHVLIVALIAAIVFAVFIEVPTYSSGSGIVFFKGTPVTAPSAGTVDAVFVQGGQEVHKGDILVKLRAEKEEADLKQASTELEAALQQYLYDRTDETIRKSVISGQAAAKRAEDALEQRTVRARAAGTISDIRIRNGSPLEFGAPILTIVPPGTEPEVWAYLPGSDRPRLRAGMPLQVDLIGFQKTREKALIYEVGRDVIGANEAKRSLGLELADAIKLAQDGGTFVLVKARLPKRTFKAKGRLYNYHHGMPVKNEVRVESKRFLVTLLPSLEKYLP
jgi:membrane fusion protein (multidrug efflux system)